jgi:hypothetical protein
MLTVASLPLALVYPRDDGRPVIKERVAVLVESLRALGLRSPITVRACQRIRNGQSADAYEIVAGRHRYEAAVSLKWEGIDAIVMDGEPDDVELWEIDENFARAELTHAQRADHHVRRRRIMIAKGLVHAKQGQPKKDTNLVSYSKEAAKALGVHENTINLDLKRGEKIDPAVLAQADDLYGAELDELAKAPRSEQPARLDEIRARRDAEKVNREFNRTIALTDAEQFAEWIMARTDLNELTAIISWLEGTKPKDVIAALRREAA